MQEFKHIVRIANTDLDGNKPVFHALRKIKGVSFMMSHAILTVLNITPSQKVGMLEDEKIENIADMMKHPLEKGIPVWMLNRRKDPEDGKDRHLVATDATYTQDNDIKLMQKIKSYRGGRHAHRQPVRGQRTKSHFRANKGKVLGVKRAKATSKKT